MRGVKADTYTPWRQIHTHSRCFLIVLLWFCLLCTSGDRIQNLVLVNLGLYLWAPLLALVVLNLIIPAEETYHTPADWVFSSLSCSYLWNGGNIYAGKTDEVMQVRVLCKLQRPVHFVRKRWFPSDWFGMEFSFAPFWSCGFGHFVPFSEPRVPYLLSLNINSVDYSQACFRSPIRTKWDNRSLWHTVDAQQMFLLKHMCTHIALDAARVTKCSQFGGENGQPMSSLSSFHSKKGTHWPEARLVSDVENRNECQPPTWSFQKVWAQCCITHLRENFHKLFPKRKREQSYGATSGGRGGAEVWGWDWEEKLLAALLVQACNLSCARGWDKDHKFKACQEYRKSSEPAWAT